MFSSVFSHDVRSLFRGTPHRRRGARPTFAQSAIEQLEPRTLMTATAVLDFTGGNIAAQDLEDYNRPGLDPVSDVQSSSFFDLFNGSLSFLDFNDDNQINAADAEIAIDRIVAKVEQHYSPYALNIIVGEQNQHRSLLTDGELGDVMVMVTGDRDTDLDIPVLQQQPFRPFLGVAPDVDVGNNDDEVVFVMGKGIALANPNPDRFVSTIAKAISHEMGHAFGLFHVSTPAAGFDADTLSHHMMATPNTRDDNHDVVFQNIEYFADVESLGAAGTAFLPQNAHASLTETLGASSGAWAAALTPGQLTIKAATQARYLNQIDVTRVDGNTWNATLRNDLRFKVFSTASAQFDTANPDINSINPYDAPLTRVTVIGSNTADRIRFDASFDVDVYAYGHGGNDRIETGSGNDHVFGGAGSDTLITNGGNDFLAGYYGVYGVTDYERDYLYGGTGRDTYFQHLIYLYSFSRRRFVGWYLEDSISDPDSTGTTIVTSRVYRFIA